MPFENIPAEEADRLGGLLRSAALRRAWRKREPASPPTTPEEEEALRRQEEEEELLQRTSLETPYFNTMAYIERVMAVMDTLQCKVALGQPSTGEDNSIPAPEAADSTKEESDQDPVVRPHPFPCLLLNSPAEMIKESWALGLTPAERRAAAAPLSRSRPAPPPAALLSDTAPQPSLVPNPTKTEPKKSAKHSPAPPPRTYTLDLLKDRAAVSRMVVVLQAELGLAISAGGVSSPHSTNNDHPKNDNCNDAESDVFIMSPDATSCVILACRVSLHPAWRQRVQASAVTGPLPPMLLTQAASTHTAAMAHLDRTEGLRETLCALVWESAVPAWLHTVAHLSNGKDTESDAGNASQHAAADHVAQAVRTLIEQLSALPANPASTNSESVPPLLEVEWYLVGGMVNKEHTAPVLTAIFSQFFPFRGAEEQEEKETPTTGPELLSTSLPLSSLMVGFTHESHEAAEAVVTCQHTLRHDAFCTWSFNTRFSNWSMDRNPNNKYYFPLCYGLLLNVTTGAAWPVQIQPGRRAYAASRLRPMFGCCYHAIFPLEHEPMLPQLEDSTTATTTKVAEGTMTVYRQRLSHAEALSEVWSKGHKDERRLPEETSLTPTPLSLSSFVAECLSVLRRQREALKRTPHAAAQYTFPVLLRARLKDLWTLHPNPHGSKIGSMIPDKALLGCSTTPHCEPPDFCTLMRVHFVLSMTVGADGVLASLIDQRTQPKKPFPADGILLVTPLE